MQEPEPFDLNTPPTGHPPRVTSPVIVLIWTVSAILFALVLTASIATYVNRTRIRELAAPLSQAESTLHAMSTPPPQVLALTDELAQTLRTLHTLQTAQPTIAAGQQDWQGAVDAILAHDQGRIQLTHLTQNGSELRLTGLAQTQGDVLSYIQALDQSGKFSQVVLQAMQEPDTTATPPVQETPTPGTPQPTVTSTTEPYDSYEVDDFLPSPIAIKEVQQHNLNPVYDVDQVVFQGQAGRRYCILAQPQAAGVDTFLEVSVGGAAWLTNDNCQPDDPALLSCECPDETSTGSPPSLIEIQIPSGRDQEVRVKVSSRDQYGPDKWYTLMVQEAPGDAWEQDDLNPVPIALGELQTRTFYPDGDVDRVTFPIQAGRAYEVRTLNLSPEVDTFLSVFANNQVYENDNISAGDDSSRLVFEASNDGSAWVTVTNRGQFGPAMGYTLQVQELAGDAYEPDDRLPKPIALWEHQVHTFFPSQDVDWVEFAVQAGHVYEVKTYNLAPGVDTTLTVLAHGQTHRNDNISSGGRSSRVVFTAIDNGHAGVTITNQGEYGADKSYWLTLSELAVVPTATTPPSPTPTRTPTPTSTPDCRDPYEPDDHVGRAVNVGAQETHSFCPAGDTDRMVFTARAGYVYDIETTELASGVDTVLTVQIGGATFAGDNRSAYDLSSHVQIQNTTGSDAPAYIAVTNKGVFGTGRTYKLKVSETISGDSQEPDDTSPASITLGAPQQRTFYPPGDVDKVAFVARAGHHYAIYTTNLAPVVDTILTVDMDSTHLTNDDRAAGDRSSYVELQNLAASDANATVMIANKGQYAPDASYTVQVDDLGIVPGDKYEPDMSIKRYIAVNQVQRHTFDPNLDIDRVTLVVQAGRRYAVLTCGNGDLPATAITTTVPFSPADLQCSPLAAGVDTLLLVNGPVTNCEPGGCQNDDALPSSEYLNSRVEFDALSDGEVTITIYNKGISFGPAAEYYLRVHELGAATPTATPSSDSAEASLSGSSTKQLAVRYLLAPAARTHPGLASLLEPGLPLIAGGSTQETGQYAVEFVLLLRLKEATP